MPEDIAMPVMERFQLLRLAVRELSDLTTRLLEVVSIGRDEGSRLREDVLGRIAALVARAPGPDMLATTEDFAAHQAMVFQSLRDPPGQ